MSYDITPTKICSNLEIESSFYVFEIKIYMPDSIIVQRKISYSNEGILIQVENNIKKIKITMCRINNINNLIIIRKEFKTLINKPILLHRNNLVLTLDNVQNETVGNDYINPITIRYLIL
jgi:hypothetical protein